MKQKFAITGFVADSLVEKLNAGKLESVEVYPELAYEEVYSRVSKKDIESVRVGASKKGKTVVQLILKDNATTETVQRSKVTKGGIKVIDDPTLNRLSASASAKVIMI